MTARVPAADTAVAGLVLVRADAGAHPVATRVQVARSFWGRFRGLMGRGALADDEGLYLPVNSIHMLFMRFVIDALFLDAPDADGVRRVVATYPGLRPWTGIVLPVRGADGVVELPAGAIDRASLAVGDEVRLGSLEA
jgi:uncharacterized membrane protein (UPF0127 family)